MMEVINKLNDQFNKYDELASRYLHQSNILIERLSEAKTPEMKNIINNDLRMTLNNLDVIQTCMIDITNLIIEVSQTNIGGSNE